ncbi:MAG: neutral zinc metallopeptidase [Bacteroidaceae bacterium]|nr:neutral zinc metallopeptidase [Bacteroidaceae bacterium]
MKLNGRRESTNVDDRRRMSGGTKAGLGIGGIILAALIAWISGGDPFSAVMQTVQENGGLGSVIGGQTEVAQDQQREFTEEEQQLAHFSKQILAGTEDVWTKIFREQGLGEYEYPRMVLYTDAVQTACGNGSAQMGPFYCSGDQALYIDLSFFSTMKQSLGADGDFAYAYVIAHEVGHHVEYLTGQLGRAHQQMARMNEADANKVSVRLELLADFYAGVWAHYDNKMFGSLEDGDIEKAIKCAEVIGDDYLQKKARGYVVTESFTHGTSAQRMKWFKLGLQTGDMSRGDTFDRSDSEL